MALGLDDAVQAVILDVQRYRPTLSFPQAIKYIRDYGSTSILDWVSANDKPAYELVLASSTIELVKTVAALEEISLDSQDIVELDGAVTIDGMDAFQWLSYLLL